jgi:Zn-dependent protease
LSTQQAPPSGPYVTSDVFTSIKNVVESEFIVQESYVDFGVPTFIILPCPTKEPFKRLVDKLKPVGYVPLLRKEAERLIIRVFPKSPPRPSKIWVNLILFLGTFGTVFYAGYLQSTDIIFLKYLMPNADVIMQAFLFTASLLAIVGLHELGHKIACELDGIEASMPYFIPGFPPYGTFGAVIFQKGPPVNRDQLFDLGISGPVVGFIVTLVVMVIGIKMSFFVPESQLALWLKIYPNIQVIPAPLVYNLLWNLIRPIPEGFIPYLHPVGWAAWIGAMVTFLNLMPVWQLDGGHIARAALGPRGHRIASMIGIASLILAGWWWLGIFLLFLSWRATHPGPLDDVSQITRSRRVGALLVIGIIILCAVVWSPFS